MSQSTLLMGLFSSESPWLSSALVASLGFLTWNFVLRPDVGKKPPWMPLIINAQNLLAFIGVRNPDIISDPAFQEKRRARGPIVREVGPFGIQWDFFGPDAIKFILSTRWREFHSGSAWPKNFQELFGDNIVFQDGVKHDRLRRLLLPAFHGANMKRYPSVMSTIINRYIDKWLSCSTDVVMYPEFRRLIFDIMAAILIGCTSDELENVRLQSLFMDFGAGLFCLRIRQPWATYGRALAARDALHAHICKVIDSRKAAAAAAATASSFVPSSAPRTSLPAEEGDAFCRPSGTGADNTDGDKQDLLDRLMAARDGDSGDGLSKEELACQTLTLMFAGHDTTTSVLLFAMLSLARLPDARRRELEDEQENVLEAAKEAPAGARVGKGAGEEVRYEDLERMPRLERFLKEVERLYPPVGVAFRVAHSDSDYAGYRIPAGTVVAYDVRSANLNPAIHPNPTHFDPDRWLPPPSVPVMAKAAAAAGLQAAAEAQCTGTTTIISESPKAMGVPEVAGAAAGAAREACSLSYAANPSAKEAVATGAAGPFGMLTFGAGPRVCIGMGFARMEVKAALALLLRRCRWTVPPGQDLSARYVPTLHCASGLVVSFEAKK